MIQRRSLVAGLAVASAAAGAGWAWWRESRPLAVAPGEIAAGPEKFDIWSQRFERPTGGEIALASLKGQPLVLNFWATWCPPCIEEMPLLDRFHRQFQARGWQVLGLAVDSPTPVREFLAKRPVSFPIGLAGMQGVELTRALGNPQGSLPFSVIFGRSGEVAARKLGTLAFDELTAWTQSVS